MLLSNKIGVTENMEMTVFCTDGDLNQIVKNNVFLFRNIKSSEAPFGEFTISFKKYVEIFNKTYIFRICRKISIFNFIITK
jgi:hypothetical protein